MWQSAVFATVVIVVVFFVVVAVVPAITPAIVSVIASIAPVIVAAVAIVTAIAVAVSVVVAVAVAVSLSIGHSGQCRHLLRKFKHWFEGHFHHSFIVLNSGCLTFLHLVELVIVLLLHKSEHHRRVILFLRWPFGCSAVGSLVGSCLMWLAESPNRVRLLAVALEY